MKAFNSNRKKKINKRLRKGALKVSQVINNKPFNTTFTGLMQRTYIYKRKGSFESFMIKKNFFKEILV